MPDVKMGWKASIAARLDQFQVGQFAGRQISGISPWVSTVGCQSGRWTLKGGARSAGWRHDWRLRHSRLMPARWRLATRCWSTRMLAALPTQWVWTVRRV